jgi:hypothetical protein
MLSNVQFSDGIFGGPKGTFGRYLGANYLGAAGYDWNVIPAMISAQSGYGDLSTTTGVPVGTPSEESMEKVGGGVNGTGIDDVPTGASVGGTVTY